MSCAFQAGFGAISNDLWHGNGFGRNGDASNSNASGDVAVAINLLAFNGCLHSQFEIGSDILSGPASFKVSKSADSESGNQPMPLSLYRQSDLKDLSEDSKTTYRSRELQPRILIH
ncbi:MAG: hypothetical protein AAFQ63_23360 [Cyanobacteria bacterium J06621_11]